MLHPTDPNLLGEEKNHTETIRCPECEEAQQAKVEHSTPWNTYIHECTKCKHLITESDWIRVKKEPTGILKELKELNTYYIKAVLKNDEIIISPVKSGFGTYVLQEDVEQIINKYLNP